jgi:hypothetical protein
VERERAGINGFCTAALNYREAYPVINGERNERIRLTNDESYM